MSLMQSAWRSHEAHMDAALEDARGGDKVDFELHLALQIFKHTDDARGKTQQDCHADMQMTGRRQDS